MTGIHFLHNVQKLKFVHSVKRNGQDYMLMFCVLLNMEKSHTHTHSSDLYSDIVWTKAAAVYFFEVFVQIMKYYVD